MWTRNRLTEMLGIEVPIIQAPMAGANTPELAAAVANAGGLGSLGLATSDNASIESQVQRFAAQSNRGLNWNFFCHQEPGEVAEAAEAMREALLPLFAERGLGVPPEARVPFATFGPAHVALIERNMPKVVSFHFGLPAPELVSAVKATGAVILSTATSAAEARWLAERGVDAVIAQGFEAGGHRGAFLGAPETQQAGTMALVPQVVDAVDLPVIAAGGICDPRQIAAAMMLGASAVQMGTAFLRSPEAGISAAHRAALAGMRDDSTRFTRLFSGRPARSVVNRLMQSLEGMESRTPPFPSQASLIGPLRDDSGEWSSLWSGQSAALARAMPAGELVAHLVERTTRLLDRTG